MLVLCVCALAVACGDTGSGAPSARPASPVPTVSERTTCDLLFGGRDKALNDAVDYLLATKVSSRQVKEAFETSDELEDIAARSPSSLRPHLESLAALLRDVAKDAYSSEKGNFDTTGLKASALEVISVCKTYGYG